MVGWTVPWLTEDTKVEVVATEVANVDADADDPKSKKIMEDLFADFNAQVDQLKGRAVAESRTKRASSSSQRSNSSNSFSSFKSSSSSKVRALRRRGQQQQQQQSPRVVLESKITHLGRTIRFESELSLSEKASGAVSEYGFSQDCDDSASIRSNKRGPRRVLPGRNRKETNSSGSGSVSTKDSSSSNSSAGSSSSPISFAAFKKLLSPLLGSGESGGSSGFGIKDSNNLLFDLKMWWASDDENDDDDIGDEGRKGTDNGKGSWSLSKVWGGLGGKAKEEEEEEEILSGSNLNATFGRDKGYSMDADFEVMSPMHSMDLSSEFKASSATSLTPNQHALAAAARRTVTFDNHLRVGSAVRRTDAIPTIMDGVRVKQATMDRRERQRRRATRFGKRASINTGLQNLSSTHAFCYFLLPLLILALTSVAAWVINEAYPQYSAGRVKKIGGDLPAIVWYFYPKSVEKRWLRYPLRFGIYAIEVAGAITAALDIYSWSVLVRAIQPKMVRRSRESYHKGKVVASINRRSPQKSRRDDR